MTNGPVYAAARIKLSLAAVSSARCFAPGLFCSVFCTGSLFCWVFCTVTVLLFCTRIVLFGELHHDCSTRCFAPGLFYSVFCTRTLFCSVFCTRTFLLCVLPWDREAVLLGELHRDCSARRVAPGLFCSVLCIGLAQVHTPVHNNSQHV